MRVNMKMEKNMEKVNFFGQMDPVTTENLTIIIYMVMESMNGSICVNMPGTGN